MGSLTLFVSVTAAVLSLILSPVRAFALYIALLLWYPGYLVFNIGTLDVSVSRVLIGVLFIRCLYDRRIRARFVWSKLDTYVSFSMFIYVAIYFVTRPLSEALENRMGFLVDTWLMYLITRFIICDRGSFVTICKWIGIVLFPLAILGVIESVAGWQPYLVLTQYCPWRPEILVINQRSGLYRATAGFFHPIIYGTVFVTFLPFVYMLRHERGFWHNLSYWLSGAVVIGGLTSMSSGPWIMLFVVIFCLIMERLKYLVKPIIVLFIVGCVLMQIGSNRPFYHVLASYSNPVGGSWWHRAKLIDCSIMYFNEWWLAGYGDKNPGWGEELGGLADTDVTNEFILAGIKYGIWGIIALIAVLAMAIKKLTFLHNSTKELVLQSFVWAIGSTLVAFIVAFMSVSLFGQMVQIFYLVLGMAGSSSNLVHGAVTARVGDRYIGRVGLVG